MEDNPPQEHQSSIPPAVTGCSKNIKPTKVAPKLLVSGQPLEIQSSNNCSSVDIVPDPEDAHLQQGGEDVSITDFVQDSSSGTSQSQEKSSIDFLPCSTGFQDKLPKVEMAPQPDDARPQQGDDVNIADFVQDSSSGTSQSQEKSSIDFLPYSTCFQDKLPKVEMAPQPDDAHPQQGDDVNIADFVQDSSSGTSQSQEKSSIDFLPCSTGFQDKLPKVEMAPQSDDAHPQQGDDVNIADFVLNNTSGTSTEIASINFLPCSTNLQDKLPKVDMAQQPEDAHPQQGDDVNITDFVQNSTSGTSTEIASIHFLPCSTDFQDKLPKVDMPTGDEDVKIADFVQVIPSGISPVVDFIPCSTEFQDKLPKVEMAPQPEDAHPQQGDNVNIAVFVQNSTSGTSTEIASIDFLPCSTDFQDKLPKVDMAQQPEDAHHQTGDEDVKIADFVQHIPSGMSPVIDFIPCSTNFEDKLPKVDMAPQPEDTHFTQGDEDTNIADFVQDSSLGTSAEKSAIFLPCSKGFQDNLPKVDMTQQTEDARLPQGDKNVNTTDFVLVSSSEMSKLIDFLPCSTDFQGEFPTVDMAPQPKDDHLPTGGEDVKIADFVQDIPSGMYTTVKSSVDFLPCCTDFQDKLQKVDMAPQLEDAHHAECDEDINIADFVQDSLSAEKSIDFLPCSTDLQDKLPKVDMVPESTARHPSFNGGGQQDIPETPQGDNLNFGGEQFNHLTPRAAKENEKKSNLSESVPEDTSPHSVYSSSIFLFLLPCLLLILSILLFFFRSSRNLLGLILCLILTILLCPYKVLRLTWRYFCSLSRRHRRVTGGTKPVSKKHDHSLTHDSTSADQHSPDKTVLEASGLKEESSSKSRIQHKENRGILLRCM